jgi:F-type H+-transporting ATPase subunit a
MGYKMDHGHIVAVNENGEKDDIGSQKIWDFSITKNVFSLFFSIIIILLVFIKAGNLYKSKPHSTPRGFWSFLELMILFVRDDIARPAIGEKYYQRYLPFLLTVFFFIWLNNLLGLIPLFPGGANLTGNIAVPMILAGMVFIITTLSGKKTYWKHIFAMPGVPKPVLLILTPVEIIGMLLKPFVLMIRLFANITAGHIIILSFFSLIFIFGEINPVAGYGASIMSVSFVIFMSFLELLVAFLQAYVFTLLAAIYFGSAVEEEH